MPVSAYTFALLSIVHFRTRFSILPLINQLIQIVKLNEEDMKRYNQDDWEINMLFDRFPKGCAKQCYCIHPGEDCGCEDCQKRHAYKTYYSPVLKKYKEYRLN